MCVCGGGGGGEGGGMLRREEGSSPCLDHSYPKYCNLIGHLVVHDFHSTPTYMKTYRHPTILT